MSNSFILIQERHDNKTFIMAEGSFDFCTEERKKIQELQQAEASLNFDEQYHHLSDGRPCPMRIESSEIFTKSERANITFHTALSMFDDGFDYYTVIHFLSQNNIVIEILNLNPENDSIPTHMGLALTPYNYLLDRFLPVAYLSESKLKKMLNNKILKISDKVFDYHKRSVEHIFELIEKRKHF